MITQSELKLFQIDTHEIVWHSKAAAETQGNFGGHLESDGPMYL
jgi:hypothetical protein